MPGGPDMADGELAISKQELKSSDDYKQASVLAIQKRQRENMRGELIGRILALVFFISFVGGVYLIGGLF